MDAFSDPTIEQVVMMTSSQVGKTTIVENTIGFHIDHDASPILVVQPTIEIAKAFSKDRLAPMIRDTNSLKGRVKDVRSRDAENTTLHKKFPGGHITMAGANSAASLSSRPIRIVLCDEVDRFPASAGTEGDPVDLAFKRATTFWNRKLGMFSTPTIKEHSRIEKAYEESDKRKYYVPCPHCREYQTLKWKQVHWPDGQPKKAIYVCEFCACEITDKHKTNMLRQGKWIAEKESVGIAGFWLSELYSPWVTFGNMASRWLQAKREGREAIKVFINTALAETWEEDGESIKDAGLYARREEYGPEIPLEAGVLTCGIDVQDNRIECEVVAWGKDEESWGIEYKILQGDPARMAIWDDLKAYLKKEFIHESGIPLHIKSACLDTGGHHTQKAYDFVKYHGGTQTYGIKGANRPGEPIWPVRASRKNIGKINLFTIGTDAAKDNIHSRLKITNPGPGYMHFPIEYDEEYFKQLTAERVIYEKGIRKWVKRGGARNEALDVRVYNVAALERLKKDAGFKLNKRVEKLLAMGNITNTNKQPESPQTEQPEIRKTEHKFNKGFKQKKGWLNSWK